MSAQLDLTGLPVLPCKGARGPQQGLLLDTEGLLARKQGRSRLQRAMQHFGAAVALLWNVDQQKYQVPPTPPEVLRDALAECRNLRGQLEQIESDLEEAMM